MNANANAERAIFVEGRIEFFRREMAKIYSLQDELRASFAAKLDSNSRRNTNRNARLLDPEFLEFAYKLFQTTEMILDGNLTVLYRQLVFWESNPSTNAIPPGWALLNYDKIQINIEMLNALTTLRPEDITQERFLEAVRIGDVGTVALLIQLGIDPSAGNNSAIQLVSRDGHVAVVNRLLQDPRVDPSTDNNLAIQVASKYGHVAVVNRLLQDHRVDPSAQDNYAIRWASRDGHVAVVNRLFQDDRVDPSDRDNEAICWASENGHVAVVDRLLQDERVDPSDRDNEAICWASAFGNVAVVDRLLQDPRVDPTVIGLPPRVAGGSRRKTRKGRKSRKTRKQRKHLKRSRKNRRL